MTNTKKPDVGTFVPYTMQDGKVSERILVDDPNNTRWVACADNECDYLHPVKQYHSLGAALRAASLHFGKNHHRLHISWLQVSTDARFRAEDQDPTTESVSNAWVRIFTSIDSLLDVVDDGGYAESYRNKFKANLVAFALSKSYGISDLEEMIEHFKSAEAVIMFAPKSINDRGEKEFE